MTITERKLKNNKTVYDNAFMYKRQRYKKSGFKTKKEAKSWEALIKSEIDQQGHYYEPCQKTLIQVWEEYFDLEKDRYAPATIYNYQGSIKKIKEYKISKKKISDMSYADIQRFFNELALSNNKGTCMNVKKIFNITFKFALRSGYIASDPMPYVQNKGKDTKDKSKKTTITSQEFITLCNELKGSSFDDQALRIILCIGYYTGGRISEILALNKTDIDVENNLISFSKKLECKDQKNGLYVNKMKTKASYSTVPIPAVLTTELMEWFEENPYNIVSCHEDGSYMKYSYVYHRIRKISRSLGIDFHLHMLRHTYASSLVGAGIDINTAKELLRHADIKTTLNIYTHASTEHKRKAVDLVFKSNYPKITPKSDRLIN